MILKWNAARDPHAMDLADEPGLGSDVDTSDYLLMCMRLFRTKAPVELGLIEEDTSPTTAEGWKEAFTQVVDKSFSTPESLTAWLGHQLSEVQRENQPARDFAIRWVPGAWSPRSTTS
jgi:hypothetical protein